MTKRAVGYISPERLEQLTESPHPGVAALVSRLTETVASDFHKREAIITAIDVLTGHLTLIQRQHDLNRHRIRDDHDIRRLLFANLVLEKVAVRDGAVCVVVVDTEHARMTTETAKPTPRNGYREGLDLARSHVESESQMVFMVVRNEDQRRVLHHGDTWPVAQATDRQVPVRKDAPNLTLGPYVTPKMNAESASFLPGF